jgi:hypothetical protein
LTFDEDDTYNKTNRVYRYAQKSYEH